MSGVDTCTLSGVCKWFRHNAPNQFNKWSHDLYLDPPSLEKMRSLQSEGVKNVIKKDDDGYYVTLSRPVSKEFRGTVKGFGPPVILDQDGLSLQTDNVGNGSAVTTKLEVYSHRIPNSPGKTAKAVRWLSSRIDHLVPFGEHSFKDYEVKAAKGMDTAPAALF